MYTEQKKDASMAYDLPPALIRSAESVTLYDIAIIIGAIYQQSIEPTQAGRVPKRISNKLIPLLSGQPHYSYEEDEYLEILLAILCEIKIIQLSEQPFPDVKPYYEPGPQLEWWAQQDMVAQTTHLLHHWCTSKRWHDLVGDNYSPLTFFSFWNYPAGRATLLKHLERCNAGQWYTTASLMEKIWDEDAFAAQPKHITRAADRRKSPETRARWDETDLELYTGMLSSTLYELGIITLGYDREPEIEGENLPNPDAFMLTELGAKALSAHDTSNVMPAEPQRLLVVQPNFELLLLQPDMPTVYSLLPFTQVNQIGVVSRLTLTRTAMLHALEKGKRIEQLQQILAERSPKEVPQNVLYTLNDWIRGYKETKISQVLLFEVPNEALATELSTSPKLRAFELQQIGPCTLVMRGSFNLQELKRTLEKEGIVVHLDKNILTRSNRSSASQSTYGRHR